MDLTPLITFGAIILIVISLSEPLASRTGAPFALVLTGAGVIMALLLSAVSGSGPISFPLPSGLFLDLFLPALIFQAALSTEVRRMLEDGVPIMILAVLAVLVATGLIGAAISPVAGLPLMGCFLLAALISTTDPSAVIGIFRSINAPARLVRLVEGESLLNDATAIALFGVFLTAMSARVTVTDLAGSALALPVPLFGGVLIGACAAFLLIGVLRLIRGRPTAQVTLTLAAPFIASLPAGASGASGVVAAFAMGATLNLAGPARIGPDGWELTCKVWGVLSHWLGASIFVLTALMIPTLLTGFGWAEAGITLLMGATALLARGLILWGVLPALSLIGAGVPIPGPFKVALLWGGLRGAMTLALALAVLESPLISGEDADRIAALATGYVLLTLILQGGTLRVLVRRVGIDRMSPIDQALAREAIALALQTAREEVSGEGRHRGVDPDVLRREARTLGDREREAVQSAERSEGVSEKDRIILGLIALAGHERELVIRAHRMGRAPHSLHQRLLGECDKLLELTRSGGRAGYRRAYLTGLRGPRALSLVWRLHELFRISRPLERITESRFELLIAQKGILGELSGFVDNRIRRIHGRRVTELLNSILQQRSEETDRALEALRLQFPGYAGETEARWVRRSALEVEEREYVALHEDRLIDAELLARLKADITARRSALDRPPRLDLRSGKMTLLRGMPQLSGLPDRELRRLSKKLQLRRMSPGELLHRREDPPGLIHLVGSGAVSVTSLVGVARIGPGEMFGHISALTRGARRIEARALSHGTLFRLDEAALRGLMGGCPELRKRIEERVRDHGDDQRKA